MSNRITKAKLRAYLEKSYPECKIVAYRNRVWFMVQDTSNARRTK